MFKKTGYSDFYFVNNKKPGYNRKNASMSWQSKEELGQN